MRPDYGEHGDMTVARNLLDDVADVSQRTYALVDKIDRHIEKMELILLVREPTAEPAADAYEGLRKQVAAMSSDRIRLLSHLVHFDAALRNGADAGQLRKMVDSWFEESGLERIEDLSHPDHELLFRRLDQDGASDAEPADEELDVVDPAYRDAGTGRVIREGHVRGIRPRQAGAPHGDGASRASEADAAAESTGDVQEPEELA